MTKEFYSYENFAKDINLLSERLPKDFKAIVGIARGGITFAHFLSEKLNIRELYTVRAFSYFGDQKLDTITISSLPDLSHIKNNKILIVDDISDSGRTFSEISKIFSREYPEIKIYSATIFLSEKSSFEPDFWIRKTSNWITFFWSSNENQI